MSSSDITSIKINKGLRDRISASASEEHQTVQRFIEDVLDERDRRRRLDAVAKAVANANVHTLDEWRTETGMWESAETDAGPTP